MQAENHCMRLQMTSNAIIRHAELYRVMVDNFPDLLLEIARTLLGLIIVSQCARC